MNTVFLLMSPFVTCLNKKVRYYDFQNATVKSRSSKAKGISTADVSMKRWPHTGVHRITNRGVQNKKLCHCQ